MKDNGKALICHYHGPDLRVRGVIPKLDNLSNINLTNEVDLLAKHPNIDYLFLPYDTKKHKKKKRINSPIRLFHCTMNRYYKGSELIINTCKKLKEKYKVEFILMEREPHQKVMEKTYSIIGIGSITLIFGLIFHLVEFFQELAQFSLKNFQYHKH